MTLIHLHDYDFLNFNPAMPVIEISLGRRGGSRMISLKGIVDSASDGSMVPRMYLEQLDARKVGSSWMRGTAGGRRKIDLFKVFVRIGQSREIITNIIATENIDDVIIGRDVLNQFIVTLNAPAHTVEISI